MVAEAALQFKFTGSLTKADSKTFHPYTFDVPEGVTNIHIDFQYTPKYATGRIHANQINVSVNDPDGIRGLWCVIRENGLDINAIASTPGFVSKEIQPGTWTAFVDSHRILPPDPVQYEMTVTLSTDPLTITAPEYDGTPRVASTEAGWYRGDLHAHTLHSDGRWDVPELTAYMRAYGLDFVSLSDHNIPTGLDQHRSQTEDGFLAMGGMELSTFYGHMLALGGNRWYEWRLGIEEGMDINRIMQQVVDAGDMLIIAHPMAIDDPFCSGCLWQFEEARPGVALGVEIWNGHWHYFNEQGLKQYHAWLNLGHRLVATSGTDIHGPYGEGTNPRIAFNNVYAEELSEKAILGAIRKGHSYVSAGPELLVTAQTSSGQTAMIGDELPNEDTTIQVQWSSAHAGDVLRLIVDGVIKETMTANESGETTWSLTAGDTKWANVELRDKNGDMWAVTNPIFFRD